MLVRSSFISIRFDRLYYIVWFAGGIFISIFPISIVVCESQHLYVVKYYVWGYLPVKRKLPYEHISGISERSREIEWFDSSTSWGQDLFSWLSTFELFNPKLKWLDVIIYYWDKDKEKYIDVRASRDDIREIVRSINRKNGGADRKK